jgi:preprotein translocase subunit SecA
MYGKLAGMTGTADTEAAEFGEIYKLDVVVVPTNRPMIRDDRGDLVYRTAEEKWEAVVEEIKDDHKRGQPVLVGTVSIEKSEMLSKLLKRAGVPHVVLNAKYHEREASIVAQAGRKGAVTIATNMAGRGTDILLGGNPVGLARSEADPEAEAEAYAQALARYRETCTHEKAAVLEAGGLHILGTERHESRRIDNQLRGRSGRQGDPGSSRFYLSLEDDLMRIFGGDRVKNLMGRLGMEHGEPIEHKMVSRAIERAQTQVEGRNFEMRKHLLEYDDVMNKQREAIYALRKEILTGEAGKDYVLERAQDVVDYVIDTHCDEKLDPRDWDLEGVGTDMLGYFDLPVAELGNLGELGAEDLRDRLQGAVTAKYEGKEQRLGPVMRAFERDIMLRVVDHAWKEHLLALDHLKEGINLRGYGQRDPKQEYKKESYDAFQTMKERIEDSILRTLFRLEPMTEEQIEEERRRRAEAFRRKFQLSSAAATAAEAGEQVKQQTVVRKGDKVGRNDPCPCGSGKKYKKCHGQNLAAS